MGNEIRERWRGAYGKASEDRKIVGRERAESGKGELRYERLGQIGREWGFGAESGRDRCTIQYSGVERKRVGKTGKYSIYSGQGSRELMRHYRYRDWEERRE